MAIKIFLDTNIVIDFFDPTRPEHIDAVEIFAAIENENFQGFLSESVLNTSAYILRKQYTVHSLKEMLSHLLTFTKIIPCNNMLYKKGLQLLSNDIEDAVLYQLAFENNLDYFITSDKKDFKKLSSVILPVITAKDLLKILR